MNFTFDPEHVEIADVLKRRLDSEYDAASRRESIDAGSDTVADMLAELGLYSLIVDEAHGGVGRGAADLMPAMQELGRALAVSSFWCTAVGARALQWGGASALQRALLPGVIDGSVPLALALTERDARHDLESVKTVALHGPAGFTLVGEKTVALFGAQAKYWIVTARYESALALFLVPTDAPNVRINAYRCIDGLPAVDIVFSKTPVPAENWLNEGMDGAALVQRVADFGASLLCAEAIGLMERARDATISHLQTRKQFGSPLSTFQALQHRLVEVAMQIEQARSLTYLAVATACSANPEERLRAVSAAKALVGEASLFVGRQCVQLHGALGLTEAMPVSHILKRLTMINQTLGDSDHHFMRFASTHPADRAYGQPE